MRLVAAAFVSLLPVKYVPSVRRYVPDASVTLSGKLSGMNTGAVVSDDAMHHIPLHAVRVGRIIQRADTDFERLIPVALIDGVIVTHPRVICAADTEVRHTHDARWIGDAESERRVR